MNVDNDDGFRSESERSEMKVIDDYFKSKTRKTTSTKHRTSVGGNEFVTHFDVSQTGYVLSCSLSVTRFAVLYDETSCI